MSARDPLLELLGLPAEAAAARVAQWGFVAWPVPAEASLLGLLEPGRVVLWLSPGADVVERAALGQVVEWGLLKERAQGNGEKTA